MPNWSSLFRPGAKYFFGCGIFVLHSLGNTMWLDPLIQRQWLPNIQQMSDNFNVRTLLLEQAYAVENPEVYMCMFSAFDTVG